MKNKENCTRRDIGNGAPALAIFWEIQKKYLQIGMEYDILYR